jgi:hypothetical protein
MSDPLEKLLKHAESWEPPPADAGAVKGRGKALKLRRAVFSALAGLLIAAAASGGLFIFSQDRSESVSPVGPVEKPDLGQGFARPAERAATVALDALSANGLHEVDGTYFNYGATTRDDEGWVLHFCSEGQSVCQSDNSDSSLRLKEEGDDLVVVAAEGNLLPHAEDLVGYREPSAPTTPSMIYGEFREQPSESGRNFILVEASIYWTGTIPAGLEADCAIQALDEQGAVVYEGPRSPNPSPVAEGARDGAFSTGIPKGKDTGNYQMVCSDYQPVHPDGGDASVVENPAGESELEYLDLDLELESDEVRTGGQIGALLNVHNDSEQTIVDPACHLGAWRYGLVPADRPEAKVSQMIVINCGEPLEMPPGYKETRYGNTFTATSPSGKPLPPGEYLAVIEIEGRSERLVEPVTVTE